MSSNLCTQFLFYQDCILLWVTFISKTRQNLHPFFQKMTHLSLKFDNINRSVDTEEDSSTVFMISYSGLFFS